MSSLLKFMRLLGPVRRVARREPLPPGTPQRWLFFQLARRFTPVIASEEPDGARFLVRTSDAFVGEQLYVYGGSKDRDVLERAFATLAALAPPGRAPADRALLEIGANIGTTTVAALRSGYVGSVVAVEAHPETACLLRQNLIANGVTDRVSVLQAAAGDRTGHVELALSEVDSGDHRVRHGGGARDDGIAGRVSLTVPATTVDALVEAGDVELDRLALVWIDAQGHEPVILEGAQTLLASDVPVLIVYWPHGLAAAGLEHLERIVGAHFTRFVDLRVDARPRPAAELWALRGSYRDESFTDVLLLKG